MTALQWKCCEQVGKLELKNEANTFQKQQCLKWSKCKSVTPMLIYPNLQSIATSSLP